MKTPSPLLAFAALSLAALSLTPGCASAPKTSSDTPPVTPITDTAVLSDSRVEISYVLGHSHRKLAAWGSGDSCTGQTQVDHQVLRESAIDRNRYAEFLGRVDQFVNAPARRPAEREADCRSPFTIILKMGQDARSLQGCRTGDDTGLGRLVREGEFLLYSHR